MRVCAPVSRLVRLRALVAACDLRARRLAQRKDVRVQSMCLLVMLVHV